MEFYFNKIKSFTHEFFIRSEFYMLIKNGRVLVGDEIAEVEVRVENGKITEIGKGLKADNDEVIDADGKYVFPGFVDIHNHGGFGGDYMDACDDSFDKVLAFHASSGTTAVLTSSVTSPVETVEKLLGYTRKYMKKENPVCRVLGAHIEGPYISHKKKGAQNEKYLRVPDKDAYDFILNNSDAIVNVTISSELPGMVEMIKKMREKGIFVSCGHDDGRGETIYPAIEAGVTNVTHWYCAASVASIVNGVRDVGMMEIGLVDDRVTLEMIADMHHLIPELVKLAYKCKGADKLCLVSDSLRASGMPEDGTLYSLGPTWEKNSLMFRAVNGIGRLLDGTFAGSLQSVSRMLKNIVTRCDVPLIDAVKMASTTPAKIIGYGDVLGSIEVGKNADFCFMDDDLTVVKTVVGGRVVWQK